MIHLTSGPALLVEAGLALFCFVDVLLGPEDAVRWVPRWAWALALLTFPLCGSLLWLVAGRPRRARLRTPSAVPAPAPPPPPAPPARTPPGPSPHPDAALVAQLLDVQQEHERTLRLWEDDLRRREQALREGSDAV